MVAAMFGRRDACPTEEGGEGGGDRGHRLRAVGGGFREEGVEEELQI
jgi:hypothetical protein